MPALNSIEVQAKLMRRNVNLKTENSGPVLPRYGEDLGFLEHFRELRRRLIASLIAVTAASVLAFVFYDRIIAILYAPFQASQLAKGDDFLFIHTIF